MASKYRLSVTKEDGSTVLFIPGGERERNLVNAIRDKVANGVDLDHIARDIEDRSAQLGIGFFVREGDVRKAVNKAANDVMGEFKKELVKIVEASIKAVIHELKSEVLPS